MQTKNFPGDFEVNAMVIYLADIPACFLAGIFIQRIKMKTLLYGFYTLQITCALAIVIWFGCDGDPGPIFPVLAALSRIGVEGAFVVAWIEHPKMFPTLFAVTSMGISNLVSRSIGLFAPLAAEIDYPIPMVMFIAVSAFAFVATFFIIDDRDPPKTAKDLSQKEPVKD